MKVNECFSLFISFNLLILIRSSFFLKSNDSHCIKSLASKHKNFFKSTLIDNKSKFIILFINFHNFFFAVLQCQCIRSLSDWIFIFSIDFNIKPIIVFNCSVEGFNLDPCVFMFIMWVTFNVCENLGCSLFNNHVSTKVINNIDVFNILNMPTTNLD